MLRPHFHNIRAQGDRLSSAADTTLLDAADADAAYIDRWYGHTWTFTPKVGASVYGRTEDFDPSPIDHLSSGRFLRVPFRRIPVIDVHSVSELREFASRIISGEDSVHVMWRGQSREHYLERSEDEQLRLYGSTAVKEPSVIPSAARSKTEFSAVFRAWAAILDVYLTERLGGVGAYSLSAQHARELASFRSSYDYRIWAFATAQHYGLPSVGLDVTTDLWTALLFALHDFSFDGSRRITTMRRLDDDAEPVLYAMAGFENDLFEDAKIAPTWLQCARPKAQAAYFFGTGWGAATNKAAERIFVALRLKDHARWRLPKKVEDLFPTSATDSFLRFLLSARMRFAEVAEEAYLSRVYYVS